MILIARIHDPKMEHPDLGNSRMIDVMTKTKDGYIRTLTYSKYGFNTDDWGDHYNDMYRFPDEEIEWWADEKEVKVIEV